MRAMVYTAPLELEIQDVPDPEPDPGEVVVEVGAAGICGSELEGFASQSPFRIPPLIMGHEFAGIRTDDGRPVSVNPILWCGSCDRCLAGETNLCRERGIIGIHRSGGFAERVAVPQENCYRLPEGLSVERAALVEPVANAVHALRLAQVHEPQPGRIGIVGAGMIGLATTVVADAHGARELALADLSDDRLDIATEAGADATGHELEGEFDLVFDAVGTPGTRRASLERLRPGGTAVWIGLHAEESGFDGRELIRGEKRVLGTFAYTDRDYRTAIELVGRIDLDWVSTAPLEEGVERFRELLDAPAPTIKTLLLPTA